MATNQRYYYLDSLRGIAAFVVMFHHYEQGAGLLDNPSTIDAMVYNLFDLGKFGVALFFLISGFVIPNSFGTQPTGRISRFVISRFFRLYPMYWITCGAALLLAYYSNDMFPTKMILANLTMLQGFAHIQDMVGVFWTLQLEMIFYAACVALAFIGRLNDTRTIALAATTSLALTLVISVGRFETELKLPVALPLSLCLMFIGTLLRQALIDRNQLAKKLSIQMIALFAVLLVPICVLSYNRDYGYQETWYRYSFTYAVAISTFLVGITLFKIERKVPIFFGQISYSLYLLHAPVYMMLTLMGFDPQRSPYLSIAGFSAVAILFSYTTYHIIEKPAIRLGKMLIRKSEEVQALEVT